MRTALVLLLSIACLTAAAAGTREPAGILRYACDPSTPRLELSVRDAGGDHVVWGENVELIDVEALQTFGEPDARGMPWRTGSEVLVRDCGPYRVEIRAGFYNANPNGEMGAADAYPIVALSGAGGGALGRFALGVCATDNPRYSHLVACPDDWATRIFIAGPPTVRGTMLELRRTYDERRQPAPLAGSARGSTPPH